jgi:hypothetical protein
MNFSEARQGEDYKVDRLVLKAMADEAEGQIIRQQSRRPLQTR